MTPEFKNVTTNCETTVYAVDYNDAGDQVTGLFGLIKGFELGAIKPLGIPQVIEQTNDIDTKAPFVFD